MTRSQRAFLESVRRLDDLQQGCLEVDRSVRRPDVVEAQCLARGWIRTEPFDWPWRRVMYLTTRGLRALQREEGRWS